MDGKEDDVSCVFWKALEDFGIEQRQDEIGRPKQYADHDLERGKLEAAARGDDEGDDVSYHHEEDEQVSGLLVVEGGAVFHGFHPRRAGYR